jgi:hypothetical protein
MGEAGMSSGGIILRMNCCRRTMCGLLNNFRTPTAFQDPTMLTMPYPTATHYRQARQSLESASPGERGGSHSKQGCSTDARSMCGGCGPPSFEDRCLDPCILPTPPLVGTRLSSGCLRHCA